VLIVRTVLIITTQPSVESLQGFNIVYLAIFYRFINKILSVSHSLFDFIERKKLNAALIKLDTLNTSSKFNIFIDFYLLMYVSIC